jgi:hypothetical protein
VIDAYREKLATMADELRQQHAHDVFRLEDTKLVCTYKMVKLVLDAALEADHLVGYAALLDVVQAAMSGMGEVAAAAAADSSSIAKSADAFAATLHRVAAGGASDAARASAATAASPDMLSASVGKVVDSLESMSTSASGSLQQAQAALAAARGQQLSSMGRMRDGAHDVLQFWPEFGNPAYISDLDVLLDVVRCCEVDLMDCELEVHRCQRRLAEVGRVKVTDLSLRT